MDTEEEKRARGSESVYPRCRAGTGGNYWIFVNGKESTPENEEQVVTPGSPRPMRSERGVENVPIPIQRSFFHFVWYTGRGGRYYDIARMLLAHMKDLHASEQ